MKKRIVTLIVFFYVILTSCNNTTPKDLTIIDGIRLGTSREELDRQYDSLKIEQKVFYSKVMYLGSKDRLHKIGVHVTDLFNLSEFRSQYVQHYGLYYSSILEGTKNIVRMNVLLAHSSSAFVYYIDGAYHITKDPITEKTNISGISQDISSIQIDEITNMLLSKYGKPIDTLKSDLIPFYVIEDNQLGTYNSDSTNIGDVLVWKTKFLDIKFFKGILSPKSTYDIKKHSYLTYLDGGNPFRTINFDIGERPCRSFSYISYKLNDWAIKILELDKVKL